MSSIHFIRSSSHCFSCRIPVSPMHVLIEWHLNQVVLCMLVFCNFKFLCRNLVATRLGMLNSVFNENWISFYKIRFLKKIVLQLLLIFLVSWQSSRHFYASIDTLYELRFMVTPPCEHWHVSVHVICQVAVKLERCSGLCGLVFHLYNEIWSFASGLVNRKVGAIMLPPLTKQATLSMLYSCRHWVLLTV